MRLTKFCSRITRRVQNAHNLLERLHLQPRVRRLPLVSEPLPADQGQERQQPFLKVHASDLFKKNRKVQISFCTLFLTICVRHVNICSKVIHY